MTITQDSDQVMQLEGNDPILDEFSPRDYPLILIALIRKMNTQAIDGLVSPHGLNTNMWRVFGALHDYGDLHISDLAERIAIERTQLSRILDQMESAGFIQRTASKTDRRQTKLRFTPKGKHAFHEIQPIVISHYEHTCRNISVPEMKVLMKLLNKMLSNLDS